MNKKIKLWGLVVILVIALVALVVYFPKGASAETIKIGFIAPLTGDVAAIGQSTKNAVQLAADEINAAGGINGNPVEIIYEDGVCNGKDASNAANKLINVDNVNYIIGGLCSSETLGVAPLAESSQTLLLSMCSSSPDVTNAGDFVFRNYPSDSFQGKFAAEFAYNELGARRVAVLSCLSDYCVGIRDVFSKRFKELGGEIVEDQVFEQTSSDLKTQLTKAKESNPDLIYIASYTESAINGLKQAKELDINVQILGVEAWADPTIWENTIGFNDGVIFTSPDLEAQTPTYFKQRYAQKYGGGSEITLCAPQGYDAVYVLKNAIETVGEDDPIKVKNALYSLEGFEGVTGPISFDSNGDIIGANYVVMVVENGKPVKR